ncbi:MAG: hypothetical protein V4593_08065 [Pseudomonadota bacterium]
MDPGLRPGAVELDGTTGAVIRASHTLTGPGSEWIWAAPGWDIAATELQWIFPRRPGARGGTARPQDILKLAFRAGFTLACIPAARSLALLPQEWRADVGGPGLTKEQVQKKIAGNLTALERVLFQAIPAARHGDVLDAIGIGRAAMRLAKTTTKHDWSLTK